MNHPVYLRNRPSSQAIGAPLPPDIALNDSTNESPTRSSSPSPRPVGPGIGKPSFGKKFGKKMGGTTGSTALAAGPVAQSGRPRVGVCSVLQP